MIQAAAFYRSGAYKHRKKKSLGDEFNIASLDRLRSFAYRQQFSEWAQQAP
jgi:hypothetical protein